MKKLVKELLVEDDVKKWKDTYAIVSVCEEKIINRMDYIIKTIFEAFGLKVSYWTAYSEDGSLNSSISENTVGWYEIDFQNYNSFPKKKLVILLKDGTEFGFDDHEFPRRWLFEDFEQELIDGKISYLKAKDFKDKIEKEYLIKKQKETAELVNSIKAKLTKQELAALKKSL